MTRTATRVRTFSSAPTLGEIREHLQLAIEIEHATIPAYLTALFSLHDGTNEDAAWVLRTVAREEMLHMSLAANVLNAIGGSPAIDNAAFVPEYPTELPHFIASPVVQIERFSKDALRTFMRIEWRAQQPAKAARATAAADRYRTIGEFYAAILTALEHVCTQSRESVVFSGDPSRQISPTDYYGSEGAVVTVTDLASARAAIELIVHQGEGDRGSGVEIGGERAYDESAKDYFASAPGEPRYVAHLYRFNEVLCERYYAGAQAPQTPSNLREVATPGVPGLSAGIDSLPTPNGPPLPVDWDAVWPIRSNPKSRDFPHGSAIRTRLERFNRAYSDLLRVLQRTFNGEPFLLERTVPSMYDLEYLGQELCRTPSGDGETTVGPSWEFVEP